MTDILKELVEWLCLRIAAIIAIVTAGSLAYLLIGATFVSIGVKSPQGDADSNRPWQAELTEDQAKMYVLGRTNRILMGISM